MIEYDSFPTAFQQIIQSIYYSVARLIIPEYSAVTIQNVYLMPDSESLI